MILNILKKLLPNFGSAKMVIIIRGDLNMGRGKIASQAAHAAVLLYQTSLTNSNPYLNSWLRLGQPKIILKVDCEKIMQSIYCSAKDKNLNVCQVRDAGKTQVSTGTLTAIGIGPNKADEIDQITKNLKLL